MDVHHNLDMITEVAKLNAKDHNCNYTIILKNPDENGEFSMDKGSTYEFVADSYFNKERPNCKIIAKTDDLLEVKEVEEPLESPFDNSRRFVIENTYLNEARDIRKSMGTTRTTTQPVVREGKKVGRNEPCPCGSGKKYKKCCN